MYMFRRLRGCEAAGSRDAAGDRGPKAAWDCVSSVGWSVRVRVMTVCLKCVVVLDVV